MALPLAKDDWPPSTYVQDTMYTLIYRVTSVRLTREESQLVSIIAGLGSRVILRKSV